jgi:uncharacterized repeat protein (TIGR01451 family)
MKNLYTLALVLLCAFVGKAQIINFPDAAFKAKLLEADATNTIASTQTPEYGLINGSGNYTWFSSSYTKIDTNNDGEIQVSEALAIKYLDVSGLYNLPGIIANLTGVESFTNLLALKCNLNIITTLNVSGLTNLQGLECRFNHISNLDMSGLTNLKRINCSSNQLPSLNVSGLTNLKNLWCGSNQLPSLNVSGLTNLEILWCNNNLLPNLNVIGLTNLKELNCENNQLPSLNVSSLINIQYLYCSNNQLPSLNVSGLTNLQTLWCGYNQLPTLDLSGLTNLQSISCDYNQLPTLDLSGLTNLQYISCSYNQLTDLDVSGFMNLQNLVCSNNQITSLNLNGLANLYQLLCDNNQLLFINIFGLTNLQILNCGYNQFYNLDVSGSTNISELWCNNNQISNLNLSGLTNLQTLYCNDNQLNTLLMKNGSNETTFNFYGNPYLQYICADEGQIVDVQNQITNFGYTNCNVNSYCTFTPGGTFYTIQGANHFDANNNGCDVNDNMLPSMKLSFTDGTVTGGLIPDASGNYHFDVQAGTHTFTPVFENPNYFNVSPASATVTFPTTATPFVQDFCVTANGTHPDLEVVLIPITRARPGFDAVYKLYYKNKGNTTQSGNISLTFNDAVLDLVSANPAVSTQTLNTLTWNFSTLVPLATGGIVFTLNINSPMETPAVIGGDLLSFMANINPISGDETPSDNSFGYRQTVVNAFDPNEKECLEGNNIALAKVGDYVHYIIRFENDGTANAQNIVVKDMIDTTKFDITTIIPESGSATYTTRITNTNQVEFIFQDINLPFAAGTNTGYVAFKIKTKPTLVTGNTFSNTASIYFDYNFPINTNTVTTTIQALATQDFEFGNYFTLYPNPAKSLLNISTKSSIEVHSITIYNLLGQVVLAIPNAQNLNAVDVSSLKTGNYFLKITSDKGSATEKFMKE